MYIELFNIKNILNIMKFETEYVATNTTVFNGHFQIYMDQPGQLVTIL